MSGPRVPPFKPALTTLEALDRLARSRERLRRSLSLPESEHLDAGLARSTGSHNAGPTRPVADDPKSPGAAPGRVKKESPWVGWLGPLANTPAGRLLLDMGRLWWARQPARVMLQVAGSAVELALQPIARRHPVRLVLCAAAVGASLVVLRPWRWVHRSTVTRGLLLGLLPQAINQLRDPRRQNP